MLIQSTMNPQLPKLWRWIAIALVVIALSLASSFLSLDHWFDALRSWMEPRGAFTGVAFVFVYALTTLLLVPGSIRTIAAGMIFGAFLGTLVAWSGALLGASMAFLVGRYLGRPRIETMTRGRAHFRAIDEAICENDWQIIVLMRLSPLIPFNISNYFFGVTRVGFWPYALASAGAMLPGTLFYASLGAAGKAGLGLGEIEHRPLQYVFFGVGLMATIALMIWVSRMARRWLEASGAAKAAASE